MREAKKKRAKEKRGWERLGRLVDDENFPEAGRF